MWLKTGSSFLPKVKGKCGQYFCFKLPGCGWPPNHSLNVGSNAFPIFLIGASQAQVTNPEIATFQSFSKGVYGFCDNMPPGCSCFGCWGNYDGPLCKGQILHKKSWGRYWQCRMKKKAWYAWRKYIYICETHFNCEWVSVKGGKRPKEPPSRFPGPI